MRLGEIKSKSGRTKDALADFLAGDREYAIAARLRPNGEPNICACLMFALVAALTLSVDKNWGVCLKQTAMTLFHSPEQQQKCLIRAVSTLKKALDMNSSDYMTLDNIGLVRLRSFRLAISRLSHRRLFLLYSLSDAV